MQADTSLHGVVDTAVEVRDQPCSAMRLGHDVQEWAALLDTLEADDWSLKAVVPLLSTLVAQAAVLPSVHRYGWQSGLRRLWARHAWGMSPSAQQQLLTLACRWDDWPLVVRIADTLAERGALSADTTCMLAHAHWHMGEDRRALRLLRPVLVGQPRNTAAYGLYLSIEEWCRYRDCFPFGSEYSVDDGELRLEPLGEHHLRDFAWQYHDPAIARLCCLPDFGSDQAWLDWLRQSYGYGDQVLFAVLHREWGFVGSVSLILHRGVGFFYYWIGSEFQGNGLGPRAVSRLLALGREQYGMRVCYANAFAENYPSRRGLGKLGFEMLTVRALPPDAQERFYRLGDPVSRQQAIRELDVLMRDMGSPMQLYDPDTAGVVGLPAAHRHDWAITGEGGET